MVPSWESLIAAVTLTSNGAVLFDFDGTLSNIVDVPDDARLIAGAMSTIHRLEGHVALLGVISSRPIEFLERVFEGAPRSLQMIGHSGLEWKEYGETVRHPEAQTLKGKMEAAVMYAQSKASPELRIEDKKLSLTIHYREHPKFEEAAKDLAREIEELFSFDIRPAKKSWEIRMPLGVDKGTVLCNLLAGRPIFDPAEDETDGAGQPIFDWAVYAGDDDGDLPAFEALRESNVPSKFRVAVGSDESPNGLIPAADIVVRSPPELVDMFEAICDASPSARR